MATYDERIAALEKDSAIMKRDIIYKLDDTNSAVTIIKGIVGSQEQNIKDISHQVRIVNMRLDGIDTRLEGLKEEIRAIKRQQDAQGQDIIEIKRQQDAQGQDIIEIKRSLQTLEGKFEQVVQLLTTLTNKIE